MTVTSPYVMSRRPVEGLVSIITPTYERQQFLQAALDQIRTQTYPAIEWLVLDDSAAPSALLSRLCEDQVSYEHTDRRLSIGEKRNRLIDRSRGEFIVHFDDDDYYGPTYVSTMVHTLTKLECDLVNLRGWFLFDVRSNFFGYWDLMLKTGPHYCCDERGVTLQFISQEVEGFRETISASASRFATSVSCGMKFDFQT